MENSSQSTAGQYKRRIGQLLLNNIIKRFERVQRFGVVLLIPHPYKPFNRIRINKGIKMNQMKQKRLTQNQSELVATFLPPKLQKNRKLSASVKLVLANIYQLYYYDNNRGKRTVFRTREDFMNDIEANDKNEVLRPHAVLMQNEMVIIKSGVRGRATEYTLNDELYNLLPSQVRGEVSDKFAESQKYNTLNTNDLQNEDTQVVSPSYNNLIDNEIQHSNVPSDTDTETELDIDKEMNVDTIDCIVHVPMQSNELTYEDINEVMNDVDRDEEERIRREWLQETRQSTNINNSDKYKEKNEWTTRCYEELQSVIQLIFNSWDKRIVGCYAEKVHSILDKVYAKAEEGWFTDKQITKFNTIINNFNSIMEKKWEVFDKQKHTTKCNHQSAVSNIEDSEPPTVEWCGKEIYFSDNPMRYMMALMEVNAEGRRRIDDWYKEHRDALKYAINQLDNNDYREHFNEVLREEGF